MTANYRGYAFSARQSTADENALRQEILGAWKDDHDRSEQVVDWLWFVVERISDYDGSSYVYFVEAPSSRLIKIGRSNDPYRRLTQLKLLSPVSLEIRGIVPGGAEIEVSFHEHFKSLNSHGEWFFAASYLTSFVDILTRPWNAPAHFSRHLTRSEAA